MSEYELTVLIQPDLEAKIEEPLKKVRDLVASAGGKITKEDNWGKKKLAYRIKKEDFAVYVCMEVELTSDAPLKISNTLNITDEIMRYLLVKIDPKAKKALEEAKEASSATVTEEE